MIKIKTVIIVLFILSLSSSYLLFHPIFGDTCRRVDTKDKVMAITFDDGPDPPYTLDLLDVLKKHNVKATFFMIGENIEKHPETAKAVYEAGHEIGSHSYSHPWLIFKSPTYVRSQITRTDILLRNLGVTGDIFFRPPHGIQFVILPYILYKENKKNILFNIDPQDWLKQDVDKISNRVLNKVSPGSIIIMHDGGGNRSTTVEATDIILTNLKERGYEVLSVGELMSKYPSCSNFGF